jgi:hypothetical protein
MSQRKKKPDPDGKEQSARFIEVAGQVQSDDAQEMFEKAIGKIINKKEKNFLIKLDIP